MELFLHFLFSWGFLNNQINRKILKESGKKARKNMFSSFPFFSI